MNVFDDEAGPLLEQKDAELLVALAGFLTLAEYRAYKNYYFKRED